MIKYCCYCGNKIVETGLGFLSCDVCNHSYIPFQYLGHMQCVMIFGHDTKEGTLNECGHEDCIYFESDSLCVRSNTCEFNKKGEN